MTDQPKPTNGHADVPTDQQTQEQTRASELIAELERIKLQGSRS